MCLRYMRGQWHEVLFFNEPYPVLSTLVHALAIQVELGLGNVDEDIEEMADLCIELLNSNTSITLLRTLSDIFEAFAKTIAASVSLQGPFGRQFVSEKVIDCLRKAVIRLPELHTVPLALAMSHYDRFVITSSDDDYKTGMAILDNVIAFCRPKDGRNFDWKWALRLASMFAITQYSIHGKPEHLEHAIYHTRTWLDGTSPEDPDYSETTRLLSDLQAMRSNDPSIHVNFQSVWFRPRTFESAKLRSFCDLTATLSELNTIKPLPRATLQDYSNVLCYDAIECLTDIADIEGGVKYCRLLLSSYPDSGLAAMARGALSLLFYRAFECTNQIEYLNEAISAARDHSTENTTISIRGSLSLHLRLILFLLTRFDLLQRREDLNELMEVCEMTAKYKNTDFFRRFSHS